MSERPLSKKFNDFLDGFLSWTAEELASDWANERRAFLFGPKSGSFASKSSRLSPLCAPSAMLLLWGDSGADFSVDFDFEEGRARRSSRLLGLPLVVENEVVEDSELVLNGRSARKLH